MKNLIRQAVAAAVFALFAHATAAQTTQDTTYSYQYDANGNLTQITDPLGYLTKYSYDALDRRIKETNPNNGVIQYGYDGLSQLTSVTDPRNLVTTYTVDGLGNQTALTSPDTGKTTKTYDAVGNVQTSTDAKGQTTTYQYDALNRITSISYADGKVITYQYDQGPNGIGRLTQMTDPSGSIQYSYDQKGRVTREVRTISGQSYTTAYRYDNAGRLTGITYPSGRSIDYTRDSAGRIRQINTSRNGVTQALVTQVIYRPFGPVQSVVFGNSQTYTRSFDLAGRLTGYTLNNQMQTVSYDKSSRITAISDAGNAANNATYGYDALDRLTSYLTSISSLSYGYDAVGNRTSKVNGSATTTYGYASTSNRLTQISGSPAIGMDVNGSTTNNSVAQFGYDARGRMVSANTPIGQVQYRINGLGQRVQKVTPTETTVFHYDRNGKLIAESSGQGTTDYVYLDDMPVAVLK